MLMATHADLTAIAKADTLIYKCEGPVVLLSALHFVLYLFIAPDKLQTSIVLQPCGRTKPVKLKPRK